MPKSETEVVHPHPHHQILPRHVRHEVVLPQVVVEVVEDTADPAVEPELDPDPGGVQVQAVQAAELCHIPDPLPDLAIGMNV